MSTQPPTRAPLTRTPGAWDVTVTDRLAQPGTRLAGLYASHSPHTAHLAVNALIASSTDIEMVMCSVLPDAQDVYRYRALTPRVPAAFWYERAMHDLSGVVAQGHPRLDTLLLPPAGHRPRPRPGAAGSPQRGHLVVDELGPVDLTGPGIFSLAYGPVRSGAGESIEFLIETPGEDIPHLTIRPHYKHRGTAKCFEGRDPTDGVLVAERLEGISTVAHALAFSHAVESVAGVQVPRAGRLIRLVHAELERLVNHVDVLVRLCDAAGLSVAYNRFGWHKELLMRVISALCGNRFSRSVVVPGGVRARPALECDALITAIHTVWYRLHSDIGELLDTSTFLDRLRGTGVLEPDLARRFGALGPIGRASGVSNDCRSQRPYDAYGECPSFPTPLDHDADVLSRMNIRIEEMRASVDLIGWAVAELRSESGPVRAAVSPVGDGIALGWAEAAQGEVLYAVHWRGGRIERCFARSASFHNLLLFRHAFHSDVFTDFAFIEASFGLSYAGVSM